MAGAKGSISIYDKDGNKVFEALCSGGDGSYIISLNDNIVTIKNGTGSTGSLVYSVENPTINTQNITVVPTPSDYSVETVTVTIPYSPTKIKFFGGNSQFEDNEYHSSVIVNQGETITATSENYNTAGGFALQYYEEVQKVQKSISLDNLARFKAKCDETYEKKGEGGGGNPSIPTPTAADNGKVLGVANGAYALQAASGGGGSAKRYCHNIRLDLNNNSVYFSVTDYNSAEYSSLSDVVPIAKTAYISGCITEKGKSPDFSSFVYQMIELDNKSDGGGVYAYYLDGTGDRKYVMGYNNDIAADLVFELGS